MLTPAERVSSVAAAAAHDLNDDLTVIASSTALALRELPLSHPVRALLLDIQNATKRCGNKTAQLLAFSHSGGAQPVAATLDRMIAQEAKR